MICLEYTSQNDDIIRGCGLSIQVQQRESSLQIKLQSPLIVCVHLKMDPG